MSKVQPKCAVKDCPHGLLSPPLPTNTSPPVTSWYGLLSINIVPGGGETEGETLGLTLGEREGLVEGETLIEGLMLGDSDGLMDGEIEGDTEGLLEGEIETEGLTDGEIEGESEGLML